MDKSDSKISKVAAWILYIVNFSIMVVCVLLFVFGVWIIASPDSLLKVISAIDNKTIKALLQDMVYLQVGIAITAISTLIFFVCFMGLYGAVTRSPFMLLMYAALVLLFLLLKCALLYYFSSNLVEKGLQDDGQWTHAMRLAFKCCENSTDLQEQKLPWSCCGPDTYPNNCTISVTYREDCKASVVTWLDKYQLTIYSSLTVFHIILASCSILRRSCSASHSHS